MILDEYVRVFLYFSLASSEKTSDRFLYNRDIASSVKKTPTVNHSPSN